MNDEEKNTTQALIAEARSLEGLSEADVIRTALGLYRDSVANSSHSKTPASDRLEAYWTDDKAPRPCMEMIANAQVEQLKRQADAMERIAESLERNIAVPWVEGAETKLKVLGATNEK